MLEDNIKDPGEGTSTSFIDPGEGTSSGYKFRSEASQWRDRQEILEAANYDEDALFATVESVAKTKNGAKSAKVVKRVLDDPHLGEPLYKYIKKLDENLAKMNDEFGRDEDGEIVTPIRALAHLLGLQYISCYTNVKI